MYEVQAMSQSDSWHWDCFLLSKEKHIMRNFLYYSLIGVLGTLMIGCGSNKIDLQGSTEYSSRLKTPDIISSTTQTVSEDVAVCNQIPTYLMNVNLEIYKDLSTGTYNQNVMKISISMTAAQAAQFEVTSNTINFFRELVDANNAPALDDKALTFRFVNRKTQALVTGYISDLNWAAIRTELTNNGITSMPSSVDFFKNHIMILNLSHEYNSTLPPENQQDGADYDALKVAHYDGGKLVHEQEGLLPAFYADPNKYRLTKPMRLQALHPFFKKIGTTESSPKQFAATLNNYCF
jgi:hypothetical protein